MLDNILRYWRSTFFSLALPRFPSAATPLLIPLATQSFHFLRLNRAFPRPSHYYSSWKYWVFTLLTNNKILCTRNAGGVRVCVCVCVCASCLRVLSSVCTYTYSHTHNHKRMQRALIPRSVALTFIGSGRDQHYAIDVAKFIQTVQYTNVCKTGIA